MKILLPHTVDDYMPYNSVIVQYTVLQQSHLTQGFLFHTFTNIPLYAVFSKSTKLMLLVFS